MIYQRHAVLFHTNMSLSIVIKIYLAQKMSEFRQFFYIRYKKQDSKINTAVPVKFAELSIAITLSG